MIIINNILQIGAIGCVLFTVFLLLMAFSGIAAAMRDEEGKFKKEKSIKTVIGGIVFIGFLFGLLYFANVNYANSQTVAPSLLKLWLNAFGVFFIVHIYDLLVLDYLIIVKWHPKFLKLPDTDYYTTFRPHMIGFLRGIPLGIVASLIVSFIFIWTR